MLRIHGLAGLLPALLAVAALPAVQEGGTQSVAVTNFPDRQEVTGTVEVGRPIPATKLVSNKALVTTALPTQVSSLTDGGILDASGFASGTLSLAVTMQGGVGAPGKVGVMLVPDEGEVLTAMRESSVVLFPITVEAAVVPSPTGIHQSTPLVVRFAFPRYRVFFYDTTPRSAEVTLYTYLGSS